MACQNDINSTSQNMVQLIEIYHATQEGCIFFGNMFNYLKKVMGAVPGHAPIAELSKALSLFARHLIVTTW